MLSPAQRERHNRSITGSKIGPICGLPAFVSKFHVYAEMSGLAEPEEFDNLRMRMGIYAEEMTDAAVRGEYGWETRKGPENGMAMKDYDYIWCLVDRLLIENGSATHTLEYKNIDGMFKKNWDADGVPPTYEAQARLQGMIFGLPSKLVAVFGGNDLVVYDFPRDEKIEAYLLGEAKQFWADLQNGIVPDPDGSNSTGTALSRVYPINKLDILEVDDTIERLIWNREIYRLAEKSAKEKKSECENKLKLKTGEHEAVKGPDGSMFKWKANKNGDRRVSVYVPPEVTENEIKSKLILTEVQEVMA